MGLLCRGAVCSSELLTNLAAAGQLACLKVACKDCKGLADACVAAAEAGNEECLYFLLAKCTPTEYSKAAGTAGELIVAL